MLPSIGSISLLFLDCTTVRRETNDLLSPAVLLHLPGLLDVINLTHRVCTTLFGHPRSSRVLLVWLPQKRKGIPAAAGLSISVTKLYGVHVYGVYRSVRLAYKLYFFQPTNNIFLSQQISQQYFQP